MAFGVEDFHDLVRLVEARPEWRAELRRLVLSDELLALPEQIALLRAETEQRFQEVLQAQRRTDERFAELAQAQRRTEEGFAELVQAQRRTEERLADLARTVAALVRDTGELKGDMLELRYQRRAHAYLGRLLRRVHVLSGEDLAGLLEQAVDRGQLTEAEKDDVLLADLVVRGRRQEDGGGEVYLLLEVSWGVGPDDVQRAVRRAGLLEKLGTTVIPVVAGRTLTGEAIESAREKQVWHLLDGQMIPPAGRV